MPIMTPDPNKPKADFLRNRVLSGKGALDPAVRAAAAANAGVPEAMATFVATIHEQATNIQDDDFAALKASGLSEDQIFELIVAAATGAGFHRLDKVRSLLEESP